MSTYTELFGAAVFSDARLQLTIDESWMQGRTTYGGLSVAICLEATQRSFPDLPPLRSANISFIGPAGGDVDARATMLRRGKSMAFVEADISGEAGLATHCTFAYGTSRDSQFNETYARKPDVRDPEDCEVYIPKGRGARFVDHFETRVAKGGRPFSGVDEHDHFIWVRHEDHAAKDVTALIALADMPPPAVTPMFPEFAHISSVTWMVNMLQEAPVTRDGWWLLQSRAEQAGNGYTSQDMLVWNADREMVIAGRQSVAIFL